MVVLHEGLERAEWLVFHGAIDEAVLLLDAAENLSGRSAIYAAWLKGLHRGVWAVRQGPRGRGRHHAGNPEYSMARSLRASLLRQLGSHDLAVVADREAMANAATPGAAIEAMTGLAADAVGLAGRALTASTMLGQARSLLQKVAADPANAPIWWRHSVRVSWVEVRWPCWSRATRTP